VYDFYICWEKKYVFSQYIFQKLKKIISL